MTRMEDVMKNDARRKTDLTALGLALAAVVAVGLGTPRQAGALEAAGHALESSGHVFEPAASPEPKRRGPVPDPGQGRRVTAEELAAGGRTPSPRPGAQAPRSETAPDKEAAPMGEAQARDLLEEGGQLRREGELLLRLTRDERGRKTLARIYPGTPVHELRSRGWEMVAGGRELERMARQALPEEKKTSWSERARQLWSEDKAVEGEAAQRRKDLDEKYHDLAAGAPGRGRSRNRYINGLGMALVGEQKTLDEDGRAARRDLQTRREALMRELDQDGAIGEGAQPLGEDAAWAKQIHALWHEEREAKARFSDAVAELDDEHRNSGNDFSGAAERDKKLKELKAGLDKELTALRRKQDALYAAKDPKKASDREAKPAGKGSAMKRGAKTPARR